MKVNSTLALTLILLSLMVAAGVVSGSWGYAVGREALKGVTQPDSRPGQTAGESQLPAHRQQVRLLKEADIIKNVKAQRLGDPGNSKDNRTSEQLDPARTKAAIEVVAAPSPIASASLAGFPISSQDQDVTLSVRSARQQEGYLLLEISLQNQGARSVQFLYSFMNVTDNQGRSFSANTEGLPNRLPPDSETFSGTVSLPTALLNDAQTLSLTLTDYPDQKLQLQVSDIPVMR
jgi:hypothetical protein